MRAGLDDVEEILLWAADKMSVQRLREDSVRTRGRKEAVLLRTVRMVEDMLTENNNNNVLIYIFFPP